MFMRFLTVQSSPEFALVFPWAVEALEWLQIAKEWWHRYESIIIIVIALWLVARKISRERQRLEERVNTLSQHVKAAIDASDTAVVKAQQASDTIVGALASFNRQTSAESAATNGAIRQQAAEGSYANWERISEIWSNLKERIDLKIEDIPHNTLERNG